ncbi:ribonuclease H-like domain-containing protein [Tanacetum coccineum]
MYENFSASSHESFDSISNRLQKIVSQLTILDLGTISFDDLYNNFKIVEQEDSTASTHVSTASTNISTTSLSDATVYAFLANQPNGSQVVHEDLEQIHKDDLEEMDLKWQLALLSLKARKFYQRTGKKIIINRSDIAGYDKSKVECFNCHKMGHFAREYRGPRNQESWPRNQESSKRTMNMEDTSSKAMVAFDGADFHEFDGGYVTFGGGVRGGKILVKMRDKKNSVLFTDTACFVVSPDFKLPNENLLATFDGKIDDGFLGLGISVDYHDEYTKTLDDAE